MRAVVTRIAAATRRADTTATNGPQEAAQCAMLVSFYQSV